LPGEMPPDQVSLKIAECLGAFPLVPGTKRFSSIGQSHKLKLRRQTSQSA